MFHFIQGKLLFHEDDKGFIISEQGGFGIEVFYRGKQKQRVKFRLFPYFDENLRTLRYFAFDIVEQKELFEQIIKLPGLGPKTAFYVASLPVEDLKGALQNGDVSFFSSISGIGDKTAKRIIVELQGFIPVLNKTSSAVEKKIINALKNYGYEANQVKETIKKLPFSLSESNIKEAISWLLKNL